MLLIDPRIDEYCNAHSSAVSPLLQYLAHETELDDHLPNMSCGHVVGSFLKLMTELVQAKNILELGTFTGYSALALAEALPANGKLISCDLSEYSMIIAQKYIAQSPHSHKIDLRLCSGLDTIEDVEGQKFDLIFIDADKENYPNYFIKCVDLLSENGIMLIDNTLWGGKVLAPDDNASIHIDKTNKLITADPRVNNILLPIRDGIQVVRKNKL